MSTRRKKSADAAKTALGGVLPQLQSALDRADSLVSDLAGTANSTIDLLQKQAKFVIQSLRASLEGLSEGSLGNVRDSAQSALGYVRKHPWQSAAVAVGVGVTAVAMREHSRRLH